MGATESQESGRRNKFSKSGRMFHNSVIHLQLVKFMKQL